MKINPTTRFSDRVADYVKYRPSYPQAVLEHLAAHCQLTSQFVIADIGSGTGIFSKLLLERGCTVHGVEPNGGMRLAAEELLQAFPKFYSVAAPAETTTLPNNSVDFVTAAQAFHWFDLPQFKQECQRILKPGGHLVVLWNDRETDTTLFLSAYERFLQKHAVDYKTVDHKQFNANEMQAFSHRHHAIMQNLPTIRTGTVMPCSVVCSVPPTCPVATIRDTQQW